MYGGLLIKRGVHISAPLLFRPISLPPHIWREPLMTKVTRMPGYIVSILYKVDILTHPCQAYETLLIARQFTML
jgi:hypothetical protein